MTVHTIGSASRDYSTIEAWVAATPAVLTANWEGDCYNDSQPGGNTFNPASTLSLGAGVTAAGFSIILTTGAGQSFRDNANSQTNALSYNASNGVGVLLNQYNTNNINVQNSGVIIGELQFNCQAGGGNGLALNFGSGATGATVRNCIFQGSTTNTALVLFNGSGASQMFNCLLINQLSTGFGLRGVNDGSSIYYSTAVYPSDLTANSGVGFGASNYGTTLFQNCASFGFATDFQITHVSSSCSNNAGHGASFPGSGGSNVGGLTYTSQFQNTTSGAMDFRVKTGSGLIDAGVTLAGITTVDILNVARPQGSAVDIGCQEYKAVVVTPPVPWKRPAIRALLVR